MVARTAAATANVDQLTWSKFWRVEINFPIVPLNRWPPMVTPEPEGRPNMPPIWPQATWMPTPVRNPTRTVRDKKSAMNPSRTRRATMRNRAVSSASAPARATYSLDPDAASPARPAAMTAAVAESAPTTRWRDEPKTANARTGKRIV